MAEGVAGLNRRQTRRRAAREQPSQGEHKRAFAGGATNRDRTKNRGPLHPPINFRKLFEADVRGGGAGSINITFSTSHEPAPVVSF